MTDEEKFEKWCPCKVHYKGGVDVREYQKKAYLAGLADGREEREKVHDKLTEILRLNDAGHFHTGFDCKDLCYTAKTIDLLRQAFSILEGKEE